MLRKYLKAAPTLIVIGVTGFAAWPILAPEGEPVEAKGASKPPESVRAAASTATLSRNPFRSDRGATVAPESSKSTPESPLTASTPGKGAGLPAEDDKAIAGLRLGGTFVDGREQLALINNKIYARGEALKAADGSPMPYIVAEVRKDRAVLRRGTRDFPLGFSNTLRAAPARAVAAKAPTKAETTARADPPARHRTSGPARHRGNSGDPRQMIVQLLSGLGEPSAGGPTAPGSLGGMASDAGINPNTIAAGIDALMGKYDDIGREGGPSLSPAGDGGTTP